MITVFAPMIYTRDDLQHLGLAPRQITVAVREGNIIRLRRDRYARPGLDETVAEAARVGGRLTCVSLLQHLGVFVLQSSALHLQVSRRSSRLGATKSGVVHLHWAREAAHDLLHVTSLRAAVAHSVRCQTPRAVIATLDSILHHGLLTMSQLESLFRDLPARFQTLFRLVDASAESGPETFVRLILRAIGARYETQVHIDGVGRVDFVVDGWLIIECDSREFHDGWARQRRDRGRDLAAARRGFVTVRPVAADILHRPEMVQQALREIIEVMGPRFGAADRSQLRKKLT